MMRAVMAFTQRRMSQAVAQGAPGQGGASATFGAATSGSALSRVSQGMSVVGNLMEFASNMQRAGATAQEAREAGMASRQEYITAQQKTNALDAEYNRLVAEQMSAASAMGIDVASGSVTEARNRARDDAAREKRLLRNEAEMNASLRRLQQIRLQNSAKNQRVAGAVQLGLGLGAAFMGG